jgi:hypothetical protein
MVPKTSGSTMQMMIPIIVPRGRVLGFSIARTAASMNAALTPVEIAVESNRHKMLEFAGTNTAVMPVKAATARE